MAHSIIQSTTIANNTTNYVDFTNIPQTFTHLRLVVECSTYGGGGDYMYVTFNGDTTTTYSSTVIGGQTTGTVTATGWNSRNNCNIDYFAVPTTSMRSLRRMDILQYRNTDRQKHYINRADASGSGTDIQTGTWRSTSAISSLRVTMNTNYFASTATLTLYGIS